MPRKAKDTTEKTEKKTTTKKATTKATSTKKTSVKVEKSPTKVSPKKDTFSFGSDAKPPVMDKDKRKKVIEEALCPKPTLLPIEPWTVEDTEYIPTKWIVIVDTKGKIYEEPVPRYLEYENFIAMISSIPDKPLNLSNRLSFQADCLYRTNFKVKGVDCQITTVPYDGSRSMNNYAHLFGIKNGTRNVGGNIVFSTPNEGMDKKSADKVVKEIIAIFEKGEEVDVKE